ncbi:ribonuclease H [Lachnospiraceae bacterium]|nr:ribonuclease H [Lachnospiraceae bacterium]
MKEFEVNVYITVELKGLRSEFGYYACTLEYMKKDGQAAMKEMSGREKNATRNMLESLALYRALNMLEKPCSVNVFADSGYLAGAVNSKWLENWEKADWKNAHGKPVKNADIWLEVSKCMKPHHVQVLSRKQHKYTGNQEKEIRARIQAEERRDREEEGFLNSLYGLYV